MKKTLLEIVGILLIVLMTSSAFGDSTIFIKTDKTVYLMDPWYWVYEAAYCDLPGPSGNAGYWPIGGYPRDVNFTITTYDDVGKVNDLGNLSYQVLDGTSILKSGSIAATADPGVYSDKFQLTDADLGGSLFTGQQTKQLTLQILNSSNEVINEQKVYVGRWGCDRCHIESGLAKSLYSWCAPTGGFYGPHGWGGILGRAGSDSNAFTDMVLKDSTLAHTPGDVLPNHELSVQRQCGNSACSPCHNGSGRVRPAPSGTPYLWSNLAKSEAVECTYCHGIEGGYIPQTGMWVDNAGYITPEHGHRNVEPLSSTEIASPWLARENCANPGCHGHINTSAEKRAIDNAKPDCRKCHGIHNKNPY
jgi:hypothetical protein